MRINLDINRKLQIVNALRWLAGLSEPVMPPGVPSRDRFIGIGEEWKPPVPAKLPPVGSSARLLLDLSDDIWEPSLGLVTVSRCLRELDSEHMLLVSNLLRALVNGPEHVDSWLAALPVKAPSSSITHNKEQ